MMETFTIGHNPTKITYNINRIGNDIDITITGGKAHIGCVAVISNQKYNLYAMENHREDELVMPIVENLICQETPTIVIKAGFHIDNITENQIKEVLENNRKAIEIIKKYIME